MLWLCKHVLNSVNSSSSVVLGIVMIELFKGVDVTSRFDWRFIIRSCCSLVNLFFRVSIAFKYSCFCLAISSFSWLLISGASEASWNGVDDLRSISFFKSFELLSAALILISEVNDLLETSIIVSLSESDVSMEILGNKFEAKVGKRSVYESHRFLMGSAFFSNFFAIFTRSFSSFRFCHFNSLTATNSRIFFMSSLVCWSIYKTPIINVNTIYFNPSSYYLQLAA